MTISQTCGLLVFSQDMTTEKFIIIFIVLSCFCSTKKMDGMADLDRRGVLFIFKALACDFQLVDDKMIDFH